jgi:hypothetical protein
VRLAFLLSLAARAWESDERRCYAARSDGTGSADTGQGRRIGGGLLRHSVWHLYED